MVLPYLATADAGLVLEVRRGARRIARVAGRARPGANTITWATRRPRAGRYALTLVASTADGQRARAVTRVRVRALTAALSDWGGWLGHPSPRPRSATRSTAR